VLRPDPALKQAMQEYDAARVACPEAVMNRVVYDCIEQPIPRAAAGAEGQVRGARHSAACHGVQCIAICFRRRAHASGDLCGDLNCCNGKRQAKVLAITLCASIQRMHAMA
jgi:hypothetical protein